jgi:hypothetical protein
MRPEAMMTTMVTELYDALRSAGAPEDKARAAAEVVASYDREFGEIRTRLGRLTTAVQIVVGMLILLLGSQAALWAEIGKLNGSVAQLGSQVTQMSGKIDQIANAVERR